MGKKIFDKRSAGYSYLFEKLELATIPHWHVSSVALTGSHRSIRKNNIVHDIYHSKYWPGDGIGIHLEFALKYDGVNLCCLAMIFKKAVENDLVDYIRSRPTGKYARRIWFFYEFLTGRRLSIDDLTTGNYTEALEPELYYTINPGGKSRRHRVVNNLLGPKEFCPVVRKTARLTSMDSIDLRKRCEDIVTSYPPEIFRRALSYLYTKETKSSFAIEHIKPGAARTEKFIASLELAGHHDFCDKDHLIGLQNRIVDPRFQDSDYRVTQNYVGQTVSFQNEIIHFICPKPEDLNDLMTGLVESHRRMMESSVSPMIHAAVIAYGFVFMHPFEDGNGRIHRFLIHNILSLRDLVPKGLMFPVSAVMLKNQDAYNESLESFSRPVMQLTEYTIDDLGKMTVLNDTSGLYSFMDMTVQAEILYDFVQKTIENELVSELSFLARYDSMKKKIQEIIDMPDRLIDLFIRLAMQNNGSLSARKREAYFDFLTDDELASMEQFVKILFDQHLDGQ